MVMNRKIIGIIICILFVSAIMPISIATEKTNNNSINSMIYCYVSIKGTATENIIRGSFTFGSGQSLYMKVNLENDGIVKINSQINPSNSVEFKGSHQIHLIGFNGFYSHILKTRIEGNALLAVWMYK